VDSQLQEDPGDADGATSQAEGGPSYTRGIGIGLKQISMANDRQKHYWSQRPKRTISSKTECECAVATFVQKKNITHRLTKGNPIKVAGGYALYINFCYRK